MGTQDSSKRTSNSAEESFDRSVDVLDELLEALRSDQGGARTEALQRALEQESSPQGVENERIADLESKVVQLSNDVDTDSDDDHGAVLKDVRSELDSTTDELATLRTAIDEREATDAALEARIDDLEAAVTELADRFASVETSAQSGRSELSATRDSPDDVAGSGDPSEIPKERVEDDVARWVQHVEKNLDARTTALASRIQDIEELEARIDDLEERIDERTAALETGIEDVNTTMEDAIKLLREGTRSELSTVKSDIEDLDDELRSSIESLEKDVDALEAHAADMTLWRNSIEGVPEDLGDGRDDEPQ